MKSTRKLAGIYGFPSKGRLRYLPRAINPQVHSTAAPCCQRKPLPCRNYSRVPWTQQKKDPKEGQFGFERQIAENSTEHAKHIEHIEHEHSIEKSDNIIEHTEEYDTRKDSLEFLIHGSAGGLERSPLENHSMSMEPAPTDLTESQLSPSDPEVTDWSRECWKSCINHDWQSVEFLLTKAAENRYSPYETNLKYILNHIMDHNQHHLALSLFQKFTPLLQNDKKSICQAIEAAFKLKKYLICEEIFTKCMNLAINDNNTQITMVKCFIANYDLTLARAFLDQIWDSVTSDHIDAYIIGVSFVARNAAELRRILQKWTDTCNGVIGPQTLALSMTGFIHLHDEEALIQAFQTAQGLGLFDHYLIQKVVLEKALFMKDNDLVAKTVSYMKSKNIALSKSPFRRAIVYYSKRRDIPALRFCVSKMCEQGFDIDGKVFNTLLVAAMKTDGAFDIVNYLEGGIKANVACNESTIEYVRRALIKKYSKNGAAINDLFVNGLKRWSSNEWVQKRIASMKAQRVPGTRRYVAVPLTEEGPGSVIQGLRADFAEGKLEDGLKKLEELMRRGILPSRAIFVIAISTLLKHKRLADADVLFHKFTECGHRFDMDIDFLALRRAILQGNSLNIPEDQYAMSLIRSFISKYPNLPLERRISLAHVLFELHKFDEAAELFDSVRTEKGGKISSLNHSGQSLTGMMNCYRARNDLLAVVKLLKDVVEGDRDIELDKPFFDVLKDCQRKARNSGNDIVNDELSKLETECRTLHDEYWKKAVQTVDDVLRVLKTWDGIADQGVLDHDDELELAERDLNISLSTDT